MFALSLDTVKVETCELFTVITNVRLIGLDSYNLHIYTWFSHCL